MHSSIFFTGRLLPESLVDYYRNRWSIPAEYAFVLFSFLNPPQTTCTEISISTGEQDGEQALEQDNANTIAIDSLIKQIDILTKKIEELVEENEALKAKIANLEKDDVQTVSQPEGLPLNNRLNTDVSGLTPVHPVNAKPFEPAYETVTEVVNNYRYDRIVKTTGTVAGWLKENDYILTDGTSKLVIDICPVWYRQFNFALGDKVTVVGELGVNKMTGAVEIDVFTIEMPDGEKIVLRNAGGPPPWAGPRHKHNKWDR